jgi:hypothetical protein
VEKPQARQTKKWNMTSWTLAECVFDIQKQAEYWRISWISQEPQWKRVSETHSLLAPWQHFHLLTSPRQQTRRNNRSANTQKTNTQYSTWKNKSHICPRSLTEQIAWKHMGMDSRTHVDTKVAWKWVVTVIHRVCTRYATEHSDGSVTAGCIIRSDGCLS